MTPNESNKLKAEYFIDSVINKSNLHFDELMMHLKAQKEKWEAELSSLNRINVFDLTDQQHNRRGYLEALTNYALRVLYRRTAKEKTITITGHNLKIKWEVKT